MAQAEAQGEAAWLIGRVEAGQGAAVRLEGSVRTTAHDLEGVVYWPDE
jgi:hypothetical protein